MARKKSKSETSEVNDVVEAEIVEVVETETTDHSPEIEDEVAATKSDDVQEDEAALEEAVESNDSPVQEEAPEAVIQESGVQETKRGAGGMILGGLVAGAIGFGAALFVMPQSPFWMNTDQAQTEIDALRAELAKLTQADSDLAAKVAASDSSAQFAKMETMQQALSEQITASADVLGSLQTRVDTLEATVKDLQTRPIVKALPDEVVKAYEDQMVQMQATLKTQREELETLAEKAAAKQANAQDIARIGVARAALGRMAAALETGAPFADALADFKAASDLAIDGAIATASQEGPVTLAMLTETYPDAARAALGAVRAQEGADAGLGGFLRKQFGARSVVPREGDDPDAVLSRAEATLKQGDIAGVLTLIAQLPDPAQAALADWVTSAKSRLDVATAMQTLRAELDK
jgi:hypothetical protein